MVVSDVQLVTWRNSGMSKSQGDWWAWLLHMASHEIRHVWQVLRMENTTATVMGVDCGSKVQKVAVWDGIKCRQDKSRQCVLGAKGGHWGWESMQSKAEAERFDCPAMWCTVAWAMSCMLPWARGNKQSEHTGWHDSWGKLGGNRGTRLLKTKTN